MKKIKLSLVAVALLGTVAAFASKSGDSITWKDADGNSISQQQYLDCPNTASTLCGTELNNNVPVDSRNYDF